MKQFQIAILLCMMCILCACPSNEKNEHRYIKIINESNKNIAFQGIIDWKDTFFYCNNSAGNTILFGIRHDSLYFFKVSMRSSGWEDYLSKGQIMDIFIVDEELYKKHWSEPCDTIRKYVPVLHRYRLKLEDLQRMNWTVVYPPKE
ncbi:hypothetical protein [uncultured Bacteroides sp.]|uniref:hypothetical protein n=1 Tax=uncultured Bacteroides sp. TaxID=162156 RepID=UPI002AAB4C51|nr:hypothetical protein [uncultured Bacteroides sp.]